MGKEGDSHQNCGFHREGAWELKGQSEPQIQVIERSELHKYWVNESTWSFCDYMCADFEWMDVRIGLSVNQQFSVCWKDF